MKNKWLRFDIDKENIFGLVCGLIMVFVSIAMALFNSEISNIILRDILMILFLGFFTPIYYILIIKKKSLAGRERAERMVNFIIKFKDKEFLRAF